MKKKGNMKNAGAGQGPKGSVLSVSQASKSSVSHGAKGTGGAQLSGAEPQKSLGAKLSGGLLRWPWVMPVLFFVLFAIFACYYLAVKNADYLYAVQEHSLFVNDKSFMSDMLQSVGGFSQWLGCWFTQMFFHPWLGTLVLVALWGVLYVVTLRALNIKGSWSGVALVPLFALLVSEVMLGYWMYYLKLQGYWFGQTISVLVMMLGIWLFRALRGWWRVAFAAVFALIAYPFIGFWSLAGVACMGLMALTSAEEEGGQRALLQKLAVLIVVIAVVFLVPIFYYQQFNRNRFEMMWLANFPVFENDKFTTPKYSIPFIVVAAFPLLVVLIQAIPVLREMAKEKALALIVSVLAFVGCAVGVAVTNYDNYNFHAELRIYRAIDECRYDDALSEVAEAAQDHGWCTRQMVLAKNIALMNRGDIGNSFFKYDNHGEPPYVTDSLKVHLVQTCGPQVYYNYGKSNFACRWAIENGVEYGFDVDELKMLVRTAMMNGEKVVAQKYIDILSNTMFYKDWAQKWQAMLNDDELYHRSVEYHNIQPLMCYDNALDGDEGLVEMYLINYFSNMNKPQPKFQEETLVYALVQKDIRMFWPRFFNYATIHSAEQMPIHYQEAAFLYGQLEPNLVDIHTMPFDQKRIILRYAKFNQTTQSMLQHGMQAEAIGEATKAEYGDTFWWFYFFCRDVHSY